MSWCLSAVVCITLIIPCINGESWVTANHGTPPVYTGLAPMKSGWSTKLFGVGNGNLQERYYSADGWIWANHGAPSTDESVASEPCVMYDGKLFIVSNKGRLFERYWSTGSNSWLWVLHGKALGSEKLRPMCACRNLYGGRVFVVGINSKLYERWWSYTSDSWQWRPHGSPPGTTIGPSAIDTCDADSGCTENEVYLVAGNGYVYSRYISAGNPGTPSWYLVGKPSGKTAWSVRVGGGIFVTTVDNYVCERLSSTNWICSRPPSTTSTPYRTTTLSKAVQVNNCAKLDGSAKYLFVNNWDDTTTSGVFQKPVNIRGKLWRFKVSGTSHNWVYHGTAAPCCSYYRPTIFMSGSCPKAFFVKSNGNVLEKYL
ncbi:unnamed protein product [Owenia fusiformis]|uniref:Uncharacterized protein n=1 Tax=Owenia fusiformis TaxID=6347 RepID=A0A8J1UKH5_OWEFU|nr:unnamed protein product [Owenia fusiformis]